MELALRVEDHLQRIVKHIDNVARGVRDAAAAHEILETVYHVFDWSSSQSGWQEVAALAKEPKKSLAALAVNIHNRIRQLPASAEEFKTLCKAVCAFLIIMAQYPPSPKSASQVIRLLFIASTDLQKHASSETQAAAPLTAARYRAYSYTCSSQISQLYSAVSLPAIVQSLPTQEVRDMQNSAFHGALHAAEHLLTWGMPAPRQPGHLNSGNAQALPVFLYAPQAPPTLSSRVGGVQMARHLLSSALEIANGLTRNHKVLFSETLSRLAVDMIGRDDKTEQQHGLPQSSDAIYLLQLGLQTLELLPPAGIVDNAASASTSAKAVKALKMNLHLSLAYAFMKSNQCDKALSCLANIDQLRGPHSDADDDRSLDLTIQYARFRILLQDSEHTAAEGVLSHTLLPRAGYETSLGALRIFVTQKYVDDVPPPAGGAAAGAVTGLRSTRETETSVLKLYATVTDRWPRDPEFAKTRLQLLKSLFLVCPPGPSAFADPASTTSSALRLADLICTEHATKRRVLSSANLSALQTLLHSQMGIAHSLGHWTASLALGDSLKLLLQAPTTSSSTTDRSLGAAHVKAGGSSTNEMAAQVLSLQSDCYSHLAQVATGANATSELLVKAHERATSAHAADPSPRTLLQVFSTGMAAVLVGDPASPARDSVVRSAIQGSEALSNSSIVVSGGGRGENGGVDDTNSVAAASRAHLSRLMDLLAVLSALPDNDAKSSSGDDRAWTRTQLLEAWLRHFRRDQHLYASSLTTSKKRWPDGVSKTEEGQGDTGRHMGYLAILGELLSTFLTAYQREDDGITRATNSTNPYANDNTNTGAKTAAVDVNLSTRISAPGNLAPAPVAAEATEKEKAEEAPTKAILTAPAQTPAPAPVRAPKTGQSPTAPGIHAILAACSALATPHPGPGQQTSNDSTTSVSVQSTSLTTITTSAVATATTTTLTLERETRALAEDGEERVEMLIDDAVCVRQDDGECLTQPQDTPTFASSAGVAHLAISGSAFSGLDVSGLLTEDLATPVQRPHEPPTPQPQTLPPAKRLCQSPVDAHLDVQVQQAERAQLPSPALPQAPELPVNSLACSLPQLHVSVVQPLLDLLQTLSSAGNAVGSTHDNPFLLPFLSSASITAATHGGEESAAYAEQFRYVLAVGWRVACLLLRPGSVQSEAAADTTANVSTEPLTKGDDGGDSLSSQLVMSAVIFELLSRLQAWASPCISLAANTKVDNIFRARALVLSAVARLDAQAAAGFYNTQANSSIPGIGNDANVDPDAPPNVSALYPLGLSAGAVAVPGLLDECRGDGESEGEGATRGNGMAIDRAVGAEETCLSNLSMAVLCSLRARTVLDGLPSTSAAGGMDVANVSILKPVALVTLLAALCRRYRLEGCADSDSGLDSAMVDTAVVTPFVILQMPPWTFVQEHMSIFQALSPDQLQECIDFAEAEDMPLHMQNALTLAAYQACFRSTHHGADSLDPLAQAASTVQAGSLDQWQGGQGFGTGTASGSGTGTGIHALDRTTPRSMARMQGRLLWRLIELADSRQEALGRVCEYEQLAAGYAANAGVNNANSSAGVVGSKLGEGSSGGDLDSGAGGCPFATKDTEAVIALAYNYGISLVELEQETLAERFMARAVGLLAYASQTFRAAWTSRMTDTYSTVLARANKINAREAGSGGETATRSALPTSFDTGASNANTPRAADGHGQGQGRGGVSVSRLGSMFGLSEDW